NRLPPVLTLPGWTRNAARSRRAGIVVVHALNVLNAGLEDRSDSLRHNGVGIQAGLKFNTAISVCEILVVRTTIDPVLHVGLHGRRSISDSIRPRKYRSRGRRNVRERIADRRRRRPTRAGEAAGRSFRQTSHTEVAAAEVRPALAQVDCGASRIALVRRIAGCSSAA